MAHERHSRYVKWVSVGESFKIMFEEELSFTLFYKFIKEGKQYILNCNIPQNTCLYEICENTVLLPGGLTQARKKSIPCNFYAFVEEYSCNSNEKNCMLSICEECKSHGLEQNNKRNDETVENDGDRSSNSDSDGDDAV